MTLAKTNSHERIELSQELEAIINLNASRGAKETESIGACPLFAGFIKKFKLVELFDRHMTKGGYHHKVGNGHLLNYMGTTIFTGSYKSLIKIDESLGSLALEAIFDDVDQLDTDAFNRQNFALALEALGQKGSEVYTDLAMSVMKDLGIPVSTVHLDATARGMYHEAYPSDNSKHLSEDESSAKDVNSPDISNIDNVEEKSEINNVEGKSEIVNDQSAPLDAVNNDEEQVCIKIAVPKYGKSKDGRNLAQVMTYGLTAQECRIPLAFELKNGNTNDYSYFPEFARESLSCLQQNLNNQLKYVVADSAAYSPKMAHVAKSNDMDLITRIPDSYNVAKSALTQAEPLTPIYSEEEWNDGISGIGTVKKEIPTGRFLRDLPPLEYQEDNQTFVYPQLGLLVYNPSLKSQKERTIQKKAKKEQKKIIEMLSRNFNCLPDATKHLEKVKKLLKFTKLEINEGYSDEIVNAPYTVKPKGRPCKDLSKYQEKIITKDKFFFPLNVEIDNDVVAAAIESECKFVITTTDISRNWTMAELFEMYRHNNVIEQTWRLAKSKTLFANAIYLKKPERICGLLWLINICVLAYAYIQFKLRQEAAIDPQFKVPSRAKNIPENPITTESVLYYMAEVKPITLTYSDDGIATLHNITPFIYQVLLCLGIEWLMIVKASSYDRTINNC